MIWKKSKEIKPVYQKFSLPYNRLDKKENKNTCILLSCFEQKIRYVKDKVK